MPATPRGGSLELVCGCMFSGKTARLIERLTQARAAGMRVLACKHALDARYDAAHLATHDGRRFEATPVENAAQLHERGLASAADVVGVDEAQFFGRPLVAVAMALRNAGVRVLVAGIDHDAWGRPFPPFPQLKPLADTVEIRSSPCTGCGRPARFSQRMTVIRDGDMVGGPESYEPRCEECFQPLPSPAPHY